MIRDLVTDSIGEVGKTRLPATALNALKAKREVTREDFLVQVRKAQRATSEGSGVWKEVSLVIAIAENNYFTEPDIGSIEMLLLAYEADKGSMASCKKVAKELNKMEKSAQEDIYENQKSLTLCHVFACIDFISEVLGEDASEALAKVSFCTKETANRWIKRKNTPRYSSGIFRLAGKLYDARAEGSNQKTLLKIALT